MQIATSRLSTTQQRRDLADSRSSTGFDASNRLCCRPRTPRGRRRPPCLLEHWRPCTMRQQLAVRKIRDRPSAVRGKCHVTAVFCNSYPARHARRSLSAWMATVSKLVTTGHREDPWEGLELGLGIRLVIGNNSCHDGPKPEN